MPSPFRMSIALGAILVVAMASDAEAQFLRRGIGYRPATTYYPSSTVRLAPSHSSRAASSNQPREYRPKSYNGRAIKNEKMYKTQFRHVYRPIKNGLTKEGANGQKLVLAEYIGTHIKDPNEQKQGDFQDLQHGAMAQELIKTSSNVEMWKEPFLDGTLRWVPFIPKTKGLNAQIETLQKALRDQ